MMDIVILQVSTISTGLILYQSPVRLSDRYIPHSSSYSSVNRFSTSSSRKFLYKNRFSLIIMNAPLYTIIQSIECSLNILCSNCIFLCHTLHKNRLNIFGKSIPFHMCLSDSYKVFHSDGNSDNN